MAKAVDVDSKNRTVFGTRFVTNYLDGNRTLNTFIYKTEIWMSSFHWVISQHKFKTTPNFLSKQRIAANRYYLKFDVVNQEGKTLLNKAGKA